MSARTTPRSRAPLPYLAGWDTYPRAFLSFLLVGLTALSGEWIVHQLEYLIEYGSRFGSVMAGSPHRLYMAPLGVSLLVATGAALGLIAVSLGMNAVRSRRLIDLLPARLARLVPEGRVSLPVLSILGTVTVLTVYQTLIYFVQENLEAAIASDGWPGLLVLLSPQHATLLPLQTIVALAGALVLWTACSLLHRSRAVLATARFLVRLFVRPRKPRVEARIIRDRIPNLRIAAGILCLRSPPRPTACSLA